MDNNSIANPQAVAVREHYTRKGWATLPTPELTTGFIFKRTNDVREVQYMLTNANGMVISESKLDTLADTLVGDALIEGLIEEAQRRGSN